MSTVLPDHLLRLTSPEVRASLGKAGRTAAEAEQAFSDGEEDKLQSAIRQYLNLHEIAFINPSMRRRSALPPGWPDFTFCYRGRACAVEAKAGSNKLDPDQQKMREVMVRNGWRWLLARSVADVQALFRAIDVEDAGPARKNISE